jgi:predicted phosphodiesterase
VPIIFVNDVHIADRPPLGRAPGYTDQIMDKLSEIRGLATEDTITIFTGDLFHVKRPAFVSHALVQRLLLLFESWPGRRMIVLGNHDMGPAGRASLTSQPIGDLIRAGTLELLEKDELVKVGGNRVLLSPAPYREDADAAYYALAPQTMKGMKWHYAIKVAHGMIMPPGSTAPFDFVSAGDIDTTGIDLFFYGHIHDDHGFYLIEQCQFVNFGSVARVARTGGNLRDVHVAVFTDDGVVDRVRLESALPAGDVFLGPQAGQASGTDDDLKAYARELATALQQGAGASIDDLLAQATEGVKEDVRTSVKSYLEAAGL